MKKEEEEEEKKQQLPSGMATCAYNTTLGECGTDTGRLLELTGISLSKNGNSGFSERPCLRRIKQRTTDVYLWSLHPFKGTHTTHMYMDT